MKKRVLVAMSGGVDSSVAAALLKEQGYECIGVNMRLWTPPGFEEEESLSGRGCCSLAAADDARRVADKLGIPFYVLNFKEPFRQKVVDYFIEEYRRGRTPNPCIACNRYMKFDLLLKKAFELEAQFVATGHYARIEYDEKNERWCLKKSADPAKDQTYTLYNLTQKQLAHTLFPLGSYRKEDVRKMAQELGLAVADKPDSQEICFIPDDDYKRFLREEAGLGESPGPIVDVTGRKIGTHRGLINYTIGQRKGLGLALGHPVYVVGMDPLKNVLVVGDDNDVFQKGLIAEDVNYICTAGFTGPTPVNAKIRYNAPESPGTLSVLTETTARLVFDTPQRAITPGQSVVFYDNDEVLGGGTIKEAINP